MHVLLELLPTSVQQFCSPGSQVPLIGGPGWQDCSLFLGSLSDLCLERL